MKLLKKTLKIKIFFSFEDFRLKNKPKKKKYYLS